ncbi:unnamed protein product [Rotaria sordida]|uniref:Uncharacterized protein n=1 Tax=Rotaria sordida TaxID=392033 RepID=A0A819JQI3_9BILA|nr:unnamed protein product [Rotaria sordida]
MPELHPLLDTQFKRDTSSLLERYLVASSHNNPAAPSTNRARGERSLAINPRSSVNTSVVLRRARDVLCCRNSNAVEPTALDDARPTLKPCKDSVYCLQQNSSKHTKQFSHPCPFSELCTRKAKEPHLTHERHNVLKCAKDKNCSNKSDPVHRANYRHTNLPDYLIPCRRQSNCPDQSLKHREKYFHGETLPLIIKASSSDLQKVQQEIEEIGRKSIAITADVSDSKSVEKMMEDAAQKLGSLDVVVANAGIGDVKSLLDTTVEEWDRVFAVNMRGVFLCYKEAAKIMIKQGRGGKIIGAGSSVAYKACAMIGPYCTTKWGIRGLTQAAAIEWAPYNITVNAYGPGFIKTSLSDKSNEEFAKLQGKTVEDIVNDAVKTIPLGRVGYPDDVANLVSFLASKDSDYITGQNILVNGGRDFS